jgi:hypothetical protein
MRADLAPAADNRVGEEAVDADKREQRGQRPHRCRERRAHAFVDRISLQPLVEGRDAVRVFAAQAPQRVLQRIDELPRIARGCDLER